MPPEVLVTPAPATAAKPLIESTAEASHLRRLIEQQPACLLRAGIDGVLLAVNEAGLRLLGGESLAQVLGTKVTKLIMPRQHEEWQEFVARIRDGSSGSIECDLTDLSATRRTILFQGVPLLDHPDGVPSMILTARDISVPRRLEAALREREISRELDDLQKQLQHGPTRGGNADDDGEVDLVPLMADEATPRQIPAEEHEAALLKEREAQQLLGSIRAELEQSLTEQRRLLTLLEDREIGHQRMVTAHETERARLQQTLAEEHQLAMLLKEREARKPLDHARTELEQARTEQQRLATVLEDREIAFERMLATHATERTALQQTLSEEHQLALVLKEREGQQLLDKARVEVEQALFEQRRLASVLDERETELQRLIAAHAAERSELQRTLTEEHQLGLVLKERESQQLLDNVRAGLVEAQVERERLTALLADREVEHQRAIAAHEAERAEFQTTLGEEQQRAAAAHQAERLQLQAALTEEHQLALLLKERESQQRVDALLADLSYAQTEQERVTALLEDREIEHQRAVAAHAADRIQLQQSLADEHQLALLLKDRDARQQVGQLRLELAEALAEQKRLSTLLEEGQTERQRLLAAHTAEQNLLQKNLAEEQQAALLVKEQELRQLLDTVRIELDQAIVDRQQLVAMLAERDNTVADYAAQQDETDLALTAALARQTATAKALADQEVELQTIEENTRSLERLATYGRVALAVGSELKTVMAAVDARAKYLLSQSGLDAANRHVIEALRGDAIEAASLARQILSMDVEMTSHSSKPETARPDASDSDGGNQ